MANDVVVHVKGKDDASKVIGGVEKKAKGLGGALGSVLKVGAIAGGVALAGAGIAAVKMGMDFGKSMAEVKTLMPDISEKAFGQMKKDILSVSAEMGIATDKAVPALYQAISAGIPRANIMDFMKVASKASIGGCTDLETAVDGLTTVVNAFGYEAGEAGRVADVMFTGVKLGKTTMEELSTSMFQAAPLAAALGLDIESVVGAAATLTKSGTPTSVAMSQIRQAMVSLAKPNKDMAELLAKTGYASGEAMFKAEGFAGALGILTDAAGGNKEVMAKAFGSVEALQAVLGLTGENAETAAADLAAVTDSAGAADEAFETMAATASFKLNKAINMVKIGLTIVGGKVIPVLMKGFESLSTFIQQNVLPVLRAFWEEHGLAIQQMLRDTAGLLMSIFIPALDTLRDAWANIAPVLEEHVIPALAKVGKFLMDHKPLLIAIGVAILALTQPWLLVAAAVVVVLAKWDEISQMFTATIPNAIGRLLSYIKSIPVVGKIVTIWLDGLKAYWTTVFKVIVSVVKTTFELIKNRIQTALNVIMGVWNTFKAIFSGDWKAAWDSFRGIFADVWNGIRAEIGTILAGVLGLFPILWSGIASGGRGMVNALIGILNDMAEVVTKGLNAVIGVADKFVSAVTFGKKSISFRLEAPGIPLLTANIGDASDAMAIFREVERKTFSDTFALDTATAGLGDEYGSLDSDISKLLGAAGGVPPVLGETGAGMDMVADAAGGAGGGLNDAAAAAAEADKAFAVLRGGTTLLGAMNYEATLAQIKLSESMQEAFGIGADLSVLWQEQIGILQAQADGLRGTGEANDILADAIDGTIEGLKDQIDAAEDAQDALVLMGEDAVGPVAEMFQDMVDNIDKATSSISGLLGIQTQEEAQLNADIAALDLEIEKVDALAGAKVGLNAIGEANLLTWARGITAKEEDIEAIEEEIKALERLKDIDGELSKKDANKLEALKEERDALEDSIDELQGKIDSLEELAGSETTAGKAARGHVEDLEAQRDALADDLEEIEATKKALGTFMDAQVEGRPTMDTLTGTIYNQASQLGLWKGDVDKLSPALREWYTTHGATIFNIGRDFNHLLLSQRDFVVDSAVLASDWTDAWIAAAEDVAAGMSEAVGAGSPAKKMVAIGTSIRQGLEIGYGTPAMTIPALATGGIVARPTSALLAGHGAEAAVPLKQAIAGAGGGDTHVHMHVQGSIMSERDIERIIVDALRAGKFRGVVPAR